MSQFYKPIKYILFAGCLLLIIVILLILLTKTNNVGSPIFIESTNSKNYFNYYLERKKFDFIVDKETFIIRNKQGMLVNLTTSSSLSSLINSGSVVDNKWYPVNSCNYIRISVPQNYKSLISDNLFIECIYDKSESYSNLYGFINNEI